MRVISGKFKSRRLKGTPPAGIRPTSDKLRETVFNIIGGSVRSSIFFDGCAGMGSMGIEALSRGASMVYFVDSSRKACAVIRENLKSLEIDEAYKILEMDLTTALASCARDGIRFDIAFVDPPYDREDLYRATLTGFSSIPPGLLILEHSKRKELPEVSGLLKKYRSLVQGDAALAFYRPETENS